MVPLVHGSPGIAGSLAREAPLVSGSVSKIQRRYSSSVCKIQRRYSSLAILPPIAWQKKSYRRASTSNMSIGCC